MFHHESWKRIYFEVKRSKVKVTSHRNIAGVGLCTLVGAGFFWFCNTVVIIAVVNGHFKAMNYEL